MNRSCLYFLVVSFLSLLVSCVEKENDPDRNSQAVSIENSPELLRADSIYKLADKLLFTDRKFKEAYTQFNLSDSLYQNLAYTPGVILSKINMANSLEKQYQPVESFKSHIFDALEYAKSADENLFEMGVLYQGIAKVYVHESKPIKWREYLLRALQVYEHANNADHPLKQDKLCKVYQDLSYVEASLYNNNAAIEYVKNSLDIALNNDINPRFAYTHLLTLYERQQAHDKTGALFNEIQRKGYFKDAPLYNLHDLYSKKANYYLDTEKFDLALATLDTLKAAFDKSSYKDHFMDWYIANNIANANFQKGDYKKVIEIISAMKIDPKYLEVKPDKNAMDMLLISRSHFKLGNYKEAEKHLQTAINHNFNAPENAADFHDTISLDRAYRKNGVLAMELYTKGQIAREVFEKLGEGQYFQTALHTYRQLHDLIKLLGARSEEDAFVSEQEFTEIYENLLELNHSVWTTEKSKEAFYEALNICDESKTVNVLNELKEINRSQLFTNIPTQLLDKERTLRQLTDSISIYKGMKADAVTMRSRDSIWNEYSEFKSQLKTEHPSYYQLKYGIDADIETTIAENYQDYNLVEFFFGRDHIFIFNNNDEIRHFDKVRLSEDLNKAIDAVSGSLRDPSTSEYKDASDLIYRKLLEKYLDTTKRMGLVLDGKLQLIPFQSLWIQKPDGSGHYLLEETTILRLNSIKQGSLGSNNNKKALAFAPFASYSNAENNRLANSGDEASRIKKLFGGVLKVDEQASKNAFIENATQFSVIHLATHSEVNKQVPLKSTIYFSDAEKTIGTDANLEIEELYSMRLNSNLVTLSSCETGIGKEVKGKGVLSISNAFNYAGVAATVMSLWKVPDAQTSELMVSFYEHLSSGKPKDEALRSAKMDYLSSHSDEALRHPYYWAGFVISGDPSPLETSIPFNWHLVLGILILGLAGLGSYFFRRRRKH